VPGGPYSLKAVGLLEFSLTRKEEWGPSNYVNGATEEVRSEGGSAIEIEMQSGDVIRIVSLQIA
jgi:hypothetical protein